MKNFSIFMVACAIACGNFAEAKLTQGQVQLINRIGNRNFSIAADRAFTYNVNNIPERCAFDKENELHFENCDLLAKTIITSYINMTYNHGYGHNQLGNVLVYANNDGKVVVLKNGFFAYADPATGNIVPDSIFESHYKVITLSLDIVKGIFAAFKDRLDKKLQNVHKDIDRHIKNLTSNNDEECIAAKAYFEDQKDRYTKEYNDAFSEQAGDVWKDAFSQDIDNYKRHTEAQVAVLQYIYDRSKKDDDFKKSIKKLLPIENGNVYSLYDACKSCREIQWVKDNADKFQCHVFDKQACFDRKVILEGFTTQKTCNDLVNALYSAVPKQYRTSQFFGYVNNNTITIPDFSSYMRKTNFNGQRASLPEPSTRTLDIRLFPNHNLPNGKISISFP